jgi:hypothetical protein
MILGRAGIDLAGGSNRAFGRSRAEQSGAEEGFGLWELGGEREWSGVETGEREGEGERARFTETAASVASVMAPRGCGLHGSGTRQYAGYGTTAGGQRNGSVFCACI